MAAASILIVFASRWPCCRTGGAGGDRGQCRPSRRVLGYRGGCRGDGCDKLVRLPWRSSQGSTLALPRGKLLQSLALPAGSPASLTAPLCPPLEAHGQQPALACWGKPARPSPVLVWLLASPSLNQPGGDEQPRWNGSAPSMASPTWSHHVPVAAGTERDEPRTTLAPAALNSSGLVSPAPRRRWARRERRRRHAHSFRPAPAP